MPLIPPPWGMDRWRRLADALIPLLVFLLPLVSLWLILSLRSGKPTNPTPSEAGPDISRSAPQKENANDVPASARMAIPLRQTKDRRVAEPAKEQGAEEAARPSRSETPATKRDCVFSSETGGRAMVSNEETPIWFEPSARAKPILDSSGGRRLLDPRHDLKVLETQKDWVKVAVVSPTWPPQSAGWSGWVLKKDLRRSQTADERNCFFVDLSKWASVSAERLEPMRKMGLRILAEDARCARIARGDFMAAGMRYFFTCYPGDGGKPYHHWLSPAKEDDHFTPPPPIEEGAAMTLCRNELEKSLRHKAILEGAPPGEMKMGALSAFMSSMVHYITMEYFLAENSDPQKAYCLVPPGGGGEVTLAGP